MLIQYFKRPSRIEELRNWPGGHLLEGFAAQTLCQSRYKAINGSRLANTFGQPNTSFIG